MFNSFLSYFLVSGFFLIAFLFLSFYFFKYEKNDNKLNHILVFSFFSFIVCVSDLYLKNTFFYIALFILEIFLLINFVKPPYIMIFLFTKIIFYFIFYINNQINSYDTFWIGCLWYFLAIYFLLFLKFVLNYQMKINIKLIYWNIALSFIFFFYYLYSGSLFFIFSGVVDKNQNSLTAFSFRISKTSYVSALLFYFIFLIYIFVFDIFFNKMKVLNKLVRFNHVGFSRSQFANENINSYIFKNNVHFALFIKTAIVPHDFAIKDFNDKFQDENHNFYYFETQIKTTGIVFKLDKHESELYLKTINDYLEKKYNKKILKFCLFGKDSSSVKECLDIIQ